MNGQENISILFGRLQISRRILHRFSDQAIQIRYPFIVVEALDAFAPESDLLGDALVLLILEIFTHKHNQIPRCWVIFPYQYFLLLVQA